MKVAELGLAVYVRDDAGDEELARAAQAGQRCFLLLYERHVERVQWYAFPQVTHAAEAEDLVSTTFFRTLTKIDTYQPRRGSFNSWLFVNARKPSMIIAGSRWSDAWYHWRPRTRVGWILILWTLLLVTSTRLPSLHPLWKGELVSHEGAGSEEVNRDFAPGAETLRVGERVGTGATG